MKALTDACLKIAVDFKQMEVEIAALEADLASFEEHAARWPGEQVALRLQALADAVTAEATQLYRNHGGKGTVCIMTAHDGIIYVTWYENISCLTEAKKSWQAPITTLPHGPFFAFIKQLLEQLHHGDWEPAVTWLQAHRKLGAPLRSILD